MMSTRMAATLLLVMAAIIAGSSVLLWVTGWRTDAIAYAVMFGTIWLAVAGLCVWAWEQGR